MIYAELNEDNTCKAILNTPNVINEPSMIEIPSYDESYLGKMYVDGEWIEIVEEDTDNTEE